MTVNGRPTRLVYKLSTGELVPTTALTGAELQSAIPSNVFRYSITGTFSGTAGLATVNFLAQSFSDNGGTANFGETEQFNVVAAASGPGSKPAPTAQLSSPGNGETLTAPSLNARRYIDVTFVSQDGSAISRASIEDGGAEFKLVGPGVADLAVDTSTGAPILVGPPVLINGTDADATSRTYRYYLKDRDAQNATELFGTGQVTLEFVAGSFATAAGVQNGQGLKQSFTLEASAPGAGTSSNPFSLGPLKVFGPSIGIADFDFKDGMLVLTIAIGVDRATLSFGGNDSKDATSQKQADSGVTAELVGILGTFDVQVDVFGLLSGNFRVNVPGKCFCLAP